MVMGKEKDKEEGAPECACSTKWIRTRGTNDVDCNMWQMLSALNVASIWSNQ